jgi:nicotinate-nucleotide--dimethylbenzimidazole phosphoribosyltransferase
MGGATKAVEDIVKDTSNTITKITQPIEKAVTAGVQDTSKNLTSALQPVEKVITAVSQDPKALAAIAFAVAAPYAAASLAPYLSGLGAYAGVAAEAITGITIQVAQGVPIEKATENALVNVAVSGATGAVQQQISKVISSPGVTNAITSTVSSGLATAAKGGSQADVEKAMTAGLAGSTASTIYKEAVDASSNVISKAVEGATAGAVTGGTPGAITGGLSSAAGALGKELAPAPTPTPAPTPAPAPVAQAPVEQVAATPSGGTTAEDLTKLAQESAKLIGPAEPPTASLNTGVVSDAGSPTPVDATINIPPSPVAGLDITQDQSQAETERLARLNQQATAPPVVEPTQGAYLPESTIDQQILDLIAEKPATTEAISPAPISVPEVAPVPTPTPITEPEPVPTLVPEPELVPEPVPAPSPVLEPETTPPTVAEPVPLAPPPISERDREILNLISPEPVTPEPVEELVTAVEPPVEVDASIPRVEVSGVGNIEPPQGAYLPDTVPAESTAIEPAPVAEGYSTSMPDESAAETARLAAKEQQILDLITPAPVAEEPKQGAFLPDTAPTPEVPDIPAADPMSQDPAQQAQAAADVPAVEVAPSTGTGLIDTPPVSDTDKQILDLISEEPTEDQSDAETERLARKEAELAGAEKGAYLPDSGTDTKTTTYKPDLFTTTYLSPKTRTAAAPTSALGSALGTTGLTSYRGAGEIEGTGSGKPRKKVWNEESLKLKDALGV